MSDDMTDDTYNLFDNWQLMTAYQQYIDRYNAYDNNNNLYQLVFNELIDNRIEYHRYLKRIQLNDISIRWYYEDRVYVGKKLEFSYDRVIVNEMMIIRKNISYQLLHIKVVNGRILDNTLSQKIKAFVLDGYESMMTIIKTRIQKSHQESRIINDLFKKYDHQKYIIPDKEKVLIKSILSSLFFSAKMKFISTNIHHLNELIDEYDRSIIMMDISTYFFTEYFTRYNIETDRINIDMQINIYEDEWKILRIYSIDRIIPSEPSV